MFVIIAAIHNEHANIASQEEFLLSPPEPKMRFSSLRFIQLFAF